MDHFNTTYSGLPHYFEFRGATVILKEMFIRDDALHVVLAPPDSAAEAIIRAAVESSKGWMLNTDKIQALLTEDKE